MHLCNRCVHLTSAKERICWECQIQPWQLRNKSLSVVVLQINLAATLRINGPGNRSLFKDSTKWQHQAPHTEWRKWLCFERCFFVVGRNRSNIGNWSYSNVFALLLAYGKTQTTWTNLHSLKDNRDCSNISVKWSFLWLLCSPFQSVNTWVFKFGNASAWSKWSTQIGDVVHPIEFPP